MALNKAKSGPPVSRVACTHLIAADNKLLKEIKARITRLYNWSKEQSAQFHGRESITDFLFQHRQDTAPTSQYGKVKALKVDTARQGRGRPFFGSVATLPKIAFY